MKVIGGIAIGAAVVMLIFAALSAQSASKMQSQVDGFTAVDRFANDITGQTQKNGDLIRSTATFGGALGVAAVLCGVVGAALLVLGSVLKPPAKAAQGSPPSPGPQSRTPVQQG